MAERKFRIIVANTRGFVAKMPFEVPSLVKMLFRNGEWKPWDGKTYDSRGEAQQAESMIGVMAKVENKNDNIRDIEEIFV